MFVVMASTSFYSSDGMRISCLLINLGSFCRSVDGKVLNCYRDVGNTSDPLAIGYKVLVFLTTKRHSKVQFFFLTKVLLIALQLRVQ